MPDPTPPLDPSGRPLPPQATMGLLNYITAHPLDEDYEHLAHRRDGAGADPDEGPRRGWSRHVPALVVIAAFGVLVGTAAVETARSEPATQESQDALVERVRELRAELADTRSDVATTEQDLEDVRSDALQASARGRELSDRLERLGVAAGTEPVTGPGVRIVVDDGPTDVADPQVVLDTDLQKLVNGLWVSGAEAIAINGQRLTGLSAIRIAGDAVTVNFRSLSRPYVVSAVGDPDELPARFVESDGGTWWLNLQSLYDLTFEMSTEEELTVPAVNEPQLRHARPVAGTP